MRDRYVGPFPLLTCFPPKAQDARREERNPDHFAENFLVAMPSNPGAGTVFRYKHMLKFRRREVGQRRCEFAELE